MKYVEDYENIPGKEWPVRPYYKRELAEAYAPTISPASALNRWKIQCKLPPKTKRFCPLVLK